MNNFSPTRILSTGLFVLLPFLTACSTETDIKSPDTSSGTSMSVSSIAETGVGPYVAVSFPTNEIHRRETWDNPRFTITGTASGIDVITVGSSCDGLTHKLQKFTPGDTEWSYTVDATYGNLCASNNTYLITGFQKNAAEETKVDETIVEISSMAGVKSAKDLPVMKRILELAKSGLASPVADTTITTVSYDLGKDTASQKTCADLLAAKRVPSPYYFLPVTPIAPGLSLGIRTGLPDDMFSPTFGGDYGKDGMVQNFAKRADEEKANAGIAFLYEDHDGRPRQIRTIPGLARISCEFGGTVKAHAVRADRIFLETQDGWSAIPDVLLYDGKTMRPAQELVRQALGMKEYDMPSAGLILKIGTTHFSLRESMYCCDVPTRIIGGKFVEYIFDLETLELVGTIVRDPQMR